MIDQTINNLLIQAKKNKVFLQKVRKMVEKLYRNLYCLIINNLKIKYNKILKEINNNRKVLLLQNYSKNNKTFLHQLEKKLNSHLKITLFKKKRSEKMKYFLH